MGRVLLALALVIAGNSGQVAHAHAAADARHRHVDWPAFHSGDLGSKRHTHLVCFGVDLGSVPQDPEDRPGQPQTSWQSSDWIADTADGSVPLMAALAPPSSPAPRLWVSHSDRPQARTAAAVFEPRLRLRV